MNDYGPVTQCQTCGHAPLTSVLFLSFLPPVNVMRSIELPHAEEPWFPAELLHCSQCQLVQLGYVADPVIIFPPEYPYTSGTTRILRENFADLQREATALLGLSGSEFVVDIGSNDGTLLKNFKNARHPVLGIEPSLAAKLAEQAGIPTLMTFFGKESAQQVLEEKGKVRLITAANVFAHILKPNDVVSAIASLLTDDGVFISENHYLLPLLQTVQYDTIYHEHLRYYSLHSVKALLERHGFTIFHVKRIPTHGGSIRVYASKSKSYVVDDSVTTLLAEEREAGLVGTGWIDSFRKRVLASKIGLYELLAGIKREGKSVVGIGAPSRSSTLINYVGLDDGMIDCVYEISGSKKINKFVPGRNIPVRDERLLYESQPDFALLLSWHIADELITNLRKNGYRGQFIVPLPEPQIRS